MGQTIACPPWIPDEYDNADSHKNISVPSAPEHEFRFSFLKIASFILWSVRQHFNWSPLVLFWISRSYTWNSIAN